MSEFSIRPKLKGARFSGHSVPLEVLKDFAAFQEMLIEVAKGEYLEENPGRMRAPRGFAKGLEVHLAGVEDGSAVLHLVLGGLLAVAPLERDYVHRAYEKILDSMASVEAGLVAKLAPAYLRFFERFGRSLQEGESIEFDRSGAHRVSLTPASRQRLLEASLAEEWTEEKTLKGCISASDKADKWFELELRNGSKIKGPLDEQHRQIIMDAFNRYEEKQVVSVQGIVQRDRFGRAKSLESVEHVNEVDPLDVESRLEELAQLKQGWLDGKGAALQSEALGRCAQAFERQFDVKLPLPYLYPTAEGGLQAEWTEGSWEVSLEIDLDMQKAELQALDVQTGALEEAELDLVADGPGWARLNETLLKIFGPKYRECRDAASEADPSEFCAAGQSHFTGVPANAQR